MCKPEQKLQRSLETDKVIMEGWRKVCQEERLNCFCKGYREVFHRRLTTWHTLFLLSGATLGSVSCSSRFTHWVALLCYFETLAVKVRIQETVPIHSSEFKQIIQRSPPHPCLPNSHFIFPLCIKYRTRCVTLFPQAFPQAERISLSDVLHQNDSSPMVSHSWFSFSMLSLRNKQPHSFLMAIIVISIQRPTPLLFC